MVQVLGIDQIQRKMESLPVKMQQQVLAAGNRAVATAYRKELNIIAPQDTVKKASMVRANPRLRKTKGFSVGLRKPFSALMHLFEFGTTERVQTTTGRRTGRMPSTPSMRQALERFTPQRIEQIWTKGASRNLQRQLTKLAGK